MNITSYTKEHIDYILGDIDIEYAHVVAKTEVTITNGSSLETNIEDSVTNLSNAKNALDNVAVICNRIKRYFINQSYVNKEMLLSKDDYDFLLNVIVQSYNEIKAKLAADDYINAFNQAEKMRQYVSLYLSAIK